ncbi:class I SAM-dependent methyltransferase [Streptomyces sp. NPDC020875]|uniref:class I SAM-dependent methyltransferase n=1 Tax=Streptomyces sp. NPDC020875 TaxID=3154898 RepID=UPI0033F60FE4
MSDSTPSHGLTGVARTLLTPLYARAHAAELLPSAGLDDPVAARLLDEAGHTGSEVLADRGNTLGSIHRTIAFDILTRRFAREHPEGTVVSAGIGLCTRAHRLADEVPDTLRWAGVDRPEVIELRRGLLPGERTRLHPASLADPDWADTLVTGPDADPGPVLVLAEGVLMYLEPGELTSFLDVCRRAFGPGTEVVADYFHPRIALSDRHPIVKATGARFRSGARDGNRLARFAPGWELAAEYGIMERISPLHRAAGLLFRTVTLGSRPYAVARLRATA